MSDRRISMPTQQKCRLCLENKRTTFKRILRRIVGVPGASSVVEVLPGGAWYCPRCDGPLAESAINPGVDRG